MPVLVPLLALAVFAQGTSEFMLAGLLPEIADDLAISPATAGLLTSTFALGMVVGAPLTAAFGRRWPPRGALSGLLALFMLMHVVGALTDSIVVLLATRVIAALANAGFLALTLAAVARVVAPERRARALAVVLAGTPTALIAGVPAGTALGAAWGWRAPLWAVALVCVPALLAVLVAAPARAQGEPVPLRRELGALRIASLRRTLVLVAVVNAATFCGYTYLAPVVLGPATLGEQAVPLVLAVFGVGACVGVGAAGRLADSHPRRLLVVTTPSLVLLWPAAAFLAPTGWAVVPVIGVLGAASFATGSALVALAVGRGTAAAPTMAGAFPTAALNVGATLGPVVGGMVIGSDAGALGPAIASAAIATIAVVLVVALPRLDPAAAKR